MIGTLIRARLKNIDYMRNLVLAISIGVFFGFVPNRLISDDYWIVGIFLMGVWYVGLPLIRVGHRCTDNEAALPLTSAQIWTAHVAAMMIAGLSLLLAAVGPSVLFAAPERASIAFWLGVNTAAALLLTVSLFQYIEPTVGQVRNGQKLVLPMLMGFFVILQGLQMSTPLVPLLTLGVGVLVLILARRRVPSAYLMVQDGTEDNEQYAWLGSWRDGRRSDTVIDRASIGAVRAGSRLLTSRRWPVLSALMRNFHTRMPGGLALFLLITGYVLARGRLDLLLLFVLTMLVVHVNLMLMPEMVRGISPLAHLPVPRRSLFASTFIPVLLFLALSIGVGFVLTWDGVDYRSRIMVAASGDDVPKIRVNPKYWQVAWNGLPETVVAPDGERNTPTVYPIVGWSKAVLYNPYEVGPENTLDFAALQYSRAYQDIFGGTADPEVIKKNYLSKSRDWTYLRRQSVPPRDGRWNRVAAGLVVFGLIWLLVMLLQIAVSPIVSGPRWFRMTAWLRRWGYTLASLLVFCFVLIIAIVNREPGEMVRTLLKIQLQRLPDLLPASAPLAMVAALAVLALIYLVGQELFARRETLMGGGVVNELNG